MTSREMFDIVHHLNHVSPDYHDIDHYLAMLTARIRLLSSYIKDVQNPPMPLATLHVNDAPDYLRLSPRFQRHGLELCLLQLDSPTLVQLAARTIKKGAHAM